MTPVAVDGDVHIFLLLLIDMAGLAGNRLVWTEQRKSGLRVPPWHVRDEPGLRTVAPVAGIAKFVTMDVLVTVGALLPGPVKFQRFMTLAAGDLSVLSLQGEPRSRVVELRPG